ncbi:hypothetical protein [Mesorhizobium sp. M0244]|uniref:hypothetical protein n=1 Tax=Mesorhizobium sp. M0244 TaxID=2956926 RepID=UPI00333677F1
MKIIVFYIYRDDDIHHSGIAKIDRRSHSATALPFELMQAAAQAIRMPPRTRENANKDNSIGFFRNRIADTRPEHDLAELGEQSGLSGKAFRDAKLGR